MRTSLTARDTRLLTCSRCQERKQANLFPVNVRNRRRRGSACKACVAEGTGVWRRAFPERAKASQAKWRVANKEKLARYARAWRAKKVGKAECPTCGCYTLSIRVSSNPELAEAALALQERPIKEEEVVE